MISSLSSFESRWLGAASGTGEAWLDVFRPGCVAALLLLGGSVRARWVGDIAPRDIAANTLIWMHTAGGLPDLWQLTAGSGRHEALALIFPVAWVAENLTSLQQQMAADFRALLINPNPAQPLVLRPLEAEDRGWSRAFMAPTLCTAARQLLEGSRMSEFFFRKVLMETKAEEFFCTRSRRVAMERVTKVREALKANLEEPPTLDDLARLCGCNPQYLSRTFSETAGTTISLYLRRLRVERAAELIAKGTCNASEAALEVGYRSLSHFSQAFRAEKGVPPSEWARQGQSSADVISESNLRQLRPSQRQPRPTRLLFDKTAL